MRQQQQKWQLRSSILLVDYRTTKYRNQYTNNLTNTDNTRSNKIKTVKTPGGILRAQHVKKLAKRPRCGDTGVPLQGIASLRSRQYATISKTKKTVSRAYGGKLSANSVKERIVRAFLIEEQKVVKRVVKEQTEAAKKDASKKSKKNWIQVLV